MLYMVVGADCLVCVSVSCSCALCDIACCCGVMPLVKWLAPHGGGLVPANLWRAHALCQRVCPLEGLLPPRGGLALLTCGLVPPLPPFGILMCSFGSIRAFACCCSVLILCFVCCRCYLLLLFGVHSRWLPSWSLFQSWSQVLVAAVAVSVVLLILFALQGSGGVLDFEDGGSALESEWGLHRCADRLSRGDPHGCCVFVT